jgi:hypothetical protein
MLSEFICAHPRCPADPDLPAIRYAIKVFREERSIANPAKERWAGTYTPAKKVTYCSWFLTTISYFLDKVDFTTLPAPPPPPPPFVIYPFPPPKPIASRVPSSPAPAAKPVRQSRLWHSGGRKGLAELEARDAAERQALLRHEPRESSSELAWPIGKADGVQPGDACWLGEASFLPRRSGKRPPEVDDPSG